MSGSLIKISDATVSSAVSSITIPGITNDYNVYQLFIEDVQCAADNKNLIVHLTVTGTADEDSNYDSAFTQVKVGSDDSTSSGTNSNSLTIAPSLSNATYETVQGILHLFAFGDSSQNSWVTVEMNTILNNSEMRGLQGAFVLTETQANDGLRFTWEGGSNFSSGKFTLYGLKK